MKTTRTKTADHLVVGTVRFTVVHANCIRIEQAAQGRFVDEPSLFAVNRVARAAFTVREQGNSVVIDTGSIRLTYRHDGAPLSADNCRADITHNSAGAAWHPGKPNTGNLGGTAETLDGWNGARPLAPGLLSRDGWFLLDDSKRPLLSKGWVKDRADASTDWYLFGYGTDFNAAFAAFAAIAGAVPMPRRYTLGAWYSRYWPYSSKEFRAIVKEYEEHGFPLDMMVMDMDWHLNDISRVPSLMKETGRTDGQIWTGYTWDRKLLPDAEKLLAWFHAQDLHVTLNDHPADGLRSFEEPYKAFMKAMGEDPKSGKTIPFDAGNRKYLETFYDHTHANLEKDGVDFWWLDWQQYKATKSIPGLTNLEWLNYYYYLRARAGGLRGQSFSRWGGWGDHRHPIHFSGDAHTTWKMLAAEVPFTATAGNVGCFFWSHDIGGHQGGRNEESYTRWCQFGAFTAALRSHSTRDAAMDRRPWSYPKWAENSMRVSFRLRSEMFPYLYSCVAQSCRETRPLTRPMYIDYPDTEAAYRNPQEYLFGDHVLVAPVCEPGIGPRRVGRQAVWFPEGVWYDYFTGERFEGPQERLVAADIDEFPLYVRAGTPIPMQDYTPRMAAAAPAELRVRVWPGEEGTVGVFDLYEDDGETEAYTKGECATTRLTATRTGDCVTVTISPAEGSYAGQPQKRSYVIELPCTDKPAGAEVNGRGVTASYDAKGQLTRIAIPAQSVRAEVTVAVRVRAANPENAARTAFIRRAGIRTPAAGADVAQLAKTALRSGSAMQKQLVLAAAGVGLFAKNETPYGYPEEPSCILYAPAGFEVGRKAEFTVAKKTKPVTLRGERMEVTRREILSLLPVPDEELLFPQAPEQLMCRLEVAGTAVTQSLEIPCDAPYWEYRKNLAPAATATASSAMPDQPPSAAIDGVVDGIPHNRFAEWASNNERAGAWIKLAWNKPVTAGRVLLFDRPVSVDHVKGGTLFLSDGTVLPVGELPGDGKTPFVVEFSPRQIDWLVFVVTAVSEQTGWVGLSEIAVYAK